MKRLVVTADDFGAATQVNEAIDAAHRSGVLTAASLMVAGPAAGDAVARARALPSLRVGLHLVLVEGAPTLPRAAVSRLVDGHGQLRTDMAALGADIAFSGKARRQLAAEITAQFEAFRDTGLALDHCNAHKHFHLHPTIGRLAIEIGARFGLKAMRVPFEPIDVLRKIEPRTPRTPSWLTAPVIALLRRRVDAARMLRPEQVFGLRWSGQMTGERLRALLTNLPSGLSEIYLHPAQGPYPGSAPGYRYREEREALMASETISACREASISLGGFGDFAMAR